MACAPGTFTDWEALPGKAIFSSMKGCMARSKRTEVNISQYPDLKIGVVPVINLEWI